MFIGLATAQSNQQGLIGPGRVRRAFLKSGRNSVSSSDGLAPIQPGQPVLKYTSWKPKHLLDHS